jgi:hypothetical protein
MDRFRCVLCHLVYRNGGRYDMPRCPRCGCLSSLFPEWYGRLRGGN